MKAKGIILGLLIFLSSNSFAQKVGVQANELPATATKFIANNFGKAKVASAVKESEYGMVHEYEVYLSDGSKVEFDKNGNWKEIDGHGKAIPTKFLDAKIVKYVKQKFPQTEILKIEKDRRNYEVKLSNGLELEFNLQGEFLRIDD